MKIALIGYGKMGHMIESIALERGHTISVAIDRDNTADFDSAAFRESDVAIEFSVPETGFDNVIRCLKAGLPVVSGTTGWSAKLPEARNYCESVGGSLIWASNFSIGVNVFMAANRLLARIMNRFPEYTPSMEEVHHIHKLDHPSGTAITLAEQIVSETDRIGSWAESEDEVDARKGVLEISHERRGEVPGIHTVEWDSEADTITITHSAKSRRGFALGAVLAAEWLPSHPGIHTVDEALGI